MHRAVCFLFTFVFLQMFWLPPIAHAQAWVGVFPAVQDQSQPNIQWFKEEMRISPKYLEEQEGILGMSWAHFLAMIFLVLFFLGALVVVYMRNKRTKEILTSLLKEEKHESKG